MSPVFSVPVGRFLPSLVKPSCLVQYYGLPRQENRETPLYFLERTLGELGMLINFRKQF